MSDEQISTEQAAKVLEADRQVRVARAAQEIEAILKRESCEIVAAPQITPDGRITVAVSIVPK